MKKTSTIIVAAAVVACFAAPAAEPGKAAPKTIKFDLLAKATLGDKPPPTFPDELQQLEGKRVRLSGFVAPYDDPEKMQKLLLLAQPGGCAFCNPPDATAVVFVRRDPKDAKLPFSYDPVIVEGTLHLWRAGSKDEEAQRFLFTIDDAKATTAPGGAGGAP